MLEPERKIKETDELEARADGGSESDFRREWPRLRDEGRRQRVLDADKHAREQMRAHDPSRIPTASLQRA